MGFVAHTEITASQFVTLSKMWIWSPILVLKPTICPWSWIQRGLGLNCHALQCNFWMDMWLDGPIWFYTIITQHLVCQLFCLVLIGKIMAAHLKKIYYTKWLCVGQFISMSHNLNYKMHSFFKCSKLNWTDIKSIKKLIYWLFWFDADAVQLNRMARSLQCIAEIEVKEWLHSARCPGLHWRPTTRQKLQRPP